ncbi:tetratricopeptide repeat protein [Luteolibacter sp. Populi]|uniref:tetratricopeptide repeat protein n=1 Tax=Luteolibacter sp. Populi TaxID=3230487 RepID=UPI003466FFBF
MAIPETRPDPLEARLTALPAWKALLGHLALTRGADLLFLITPDATGAKACRQALSLALPESRRPIRNLEPDIPNDPAELVHCFDNASTLPAPGLLWIELPAEVIEWALPAAQAAWDRAFAALNPHRNRLLGEISVPLIFAGPPWMFQSFRSHAPDWFSVRSGVFDLTREDVRPRVPEEVPFVGESGNAAVLSEAGYTPPDFGEDSVPPENIEGMLDRLPAPLLVLLQSLTWLDVSAPIPAWLVAAHPSLPEDADLLESLRALVDRGLLECSSDGLWFRLQPQIAAATLARFGNGDQLTRALERALDMFEGADIGNPANPANWPRWIPGAVHATHLAASAEAFGKSNEAAGLLNLAGNLYLTRAQYAVAESLFRKALAMTENSLLEATSLLATLENNLAQLLQATNRLTEAEPLMRDVLRIESAALGDDHPKVATALNNLASLLKATNRLAEAEPLMRNALRIDRAAFGDDHPEVATDLNNLAQLLKATNRLAEAEPLMRDALRIDRAAFGDDHPEVATDLNNLASLLKATNRLAEAEPLMRDALRIDRAAFGDHHPKVAVRLNNLAQLLQATNRLAEAEPLMRDALRIDRDAFGDDHPDVATDLNNLAQLLKATNRLAEAEPLMRDTLRIDRAAFGDGHPTVATDLNNLASLLKATNRLAEAEPLMREALCIDRAAFGDENATISKDLNNLSLLLQETNRLTEAEPLMREALRVVHNSLGPEHPDALLVSNNLQGLMAKIDASSALDGE